MTGTQLEKNIIYVTTFNSKLFHATACNMLKSFARHMSDAEILVCYEDNLGEQIKEVVPNVQIYDLDSDDFLHNWLEDNKDIVSVEYGGKYTGKWDEIKHKYGTDFNYHTPRWMRKIASLNQIRKLDYKYIILIDCDTKFLKPISKEFIYKLFGELDMIYMLGPLRRKIGTGIEAGFVGLTKPVIDEIINIYTERFRQYERWDDGFIFRRLVEEEKFKTKDLVESGMSAHTVQFTSLAKYFTHKKGIHKNLLNAI